MGNGIRCLGLNGAALFDQGQHVAETGRVRAAHDLIHGGFSAAHHHPGMPHALQSQIAVMRRARAHGVGRDMDTVRVQGVQRGLQNADVGLDACEQQGWSGLFS